MLLEPDAKGRRSGLPRDEFSSILNPNAQALGSLKKINLLNQKVNARALQIWTLECRRDQHDMGNVGSPRFGWFFTCFKLFMAPFFTIQYL